MAERDYKQERKTMLERGERDGHTKRLRARRVAVKKGMVAPHDGKDVDHVKPLSKGGSNKPANWQVKSKSANRSFPRKPDGSMK